MSTYAWVITKDHLAEAERKHGGSVEDDATGTAGPRDVTPEQLDNATRGYLFRLLDDDGVLYYTGRITFDTGAPPAARLLGEGWKPGSYCVCGGLSGDEQADFGPLWDFGTPNAGATEIQYKVLVTDEDGDPVKVWATL